MDERTTRSEAEAQSPLKSSEVPSDSWSRSSTSFDVKGIMPTPQSYLSLDPHLGNPILLLNCLFNMC